jgi:hypothetical protein
MYTCYKFIVAARLALTLRTYYGTRRIQNHLPSAT